MILSPSESLQSQLRIGSGGEELMFQNSERLMVMAALIAAIGQIIIVLGKPEKAASTIKNMGKVLKDDWHMANNHSISNLLSPVS